MSCNRRRFLSATGVCAATAGAGAWWLSVSERRTARWARTLVRDFRRATTPAPARPVPGRWGNNTITVAWLGHASTLINFYGLTILTDPVLGSRCGVTLGIGTVGPKRYVAPALEVGELPPVDVVLLSHAHMDHFDLPTLAGLPPTAQIITARDTSDLLPPARFARVTELGWGDHTVARTSNGEVRVDAFEVRHWGRRWPGTKERGYNGYVIRREGRAILFGGDTAFTPLFQRLRPAGPFELALMPIAAYRPWIRNHCTPEEAVAMADQAGARRIVPIHHSTFRLSDEPMEEPMERFEMALERERERIALRRVGEQVSVA